MACAVIPNRKPRGRSKLPAAYPPRAAHAILTAYEGLAECAPNFDLLP